MMGLTMDGVMHRSLILLLRRSLHKRMLSIAVALLIIAGLLVVFSAYCIAIGHPKFLPTALDQDLVGIGAFISALASCLTAFAALKTARNKKSNQTEHVHGHYPAPGYNTPRYNDKPYRGRHRSH